MGYSWAGLTKTRLAKEARDMANPAVVAGIHARMEENELEAKRIEQSGDRYAEKRAARWRENNIAPDAAFLAKYGHETK